MREIRCGLIALAMLLSTAVATTAQVSVSIGLPHVSIGINLPLFPDLVPVPGYPVYYAPRVDGNYFFYDGMYWVYQDDTWYASSWYNGPWEFVESDYVPLFILRVPVRYYRHHPVYFRDWRPDEPPRWGEHWGREWEHRHGGWDRWERSSAPPPAPLPVYQRSYSGDRYPRVEQQQTLHRQKYRYEPRDTVVRQHTQRQIEKKASKPDQREMRQEPEQKSPKQQESRRSPSRLREAPDRPSAQTSNRSRENVQPSAPAAREQRNPAGEQRQKQQAAAHERVRQAPTAHEQGARSQTREEPRKSKQPRGQEQQDGEEEERGRERNR